MQIKACKPQVVNNNRDKLQLNRNLWKTLTQMNTQVINKMLMLGVNISNNIEMIQKLN